MIDPKAIIDVLNQLRLHPQAKERHVQDVIEAALQVAGIRYTRECCLSPGERIDFLAQDGIGIEVKNGKPNSTDLAAQLARYAAHDAVKSLIVVVASSAFSVPREINWKRCYYVSLAANWGVAI